MPTCNWSPSIEAIDPRLGGALWNTAQTRQIEQASRGIEPEHQLMRRAGLSVARWIMAVAPQARRVRVWAGPGGNGGDGLYAAAVLRRQGWDVRATLCHDSASLRPQTALALQAAQDSGVEISNLSIQSPTEPWADVEVDALLGIGGSRPPRGAIAHAIRSLQDPGVPVLSVDLPSGLDADSGSCLGDFAVQAQHTLCLLTLKPGVFTGAGPTQAGQVWLDTLGFERMWPQDRLLSLTAWTQARSTWPVRRHQDHKGTFGDALVLGGAPGMQGAAHLAAQACLAAGPGRTFLWTLDTTQPQESAARPEILRCKPGWHPGSSLLGDKTVICGCGGGVEVRAALPDVLHRSARLVLDADALNAVAAEEALKTSLRGRAGRGFPTVLTPHPLEAARLLEVPTTSVQSDRRAAARELAQKFSCVVVLKGSGTVTHDGRRAWINPTGGPNLATGGTGDVLAGWLGSLWAQWSKDVDEFQRAAEVAAGAVWWHGHAADELGQREGHWPVRGLDLIECLRECASSAA